MFEFLKRNQPEEKPTTEIGETGLQRTGGFIDEEFLNALKGTRGARTYREMADNDAIVGAILFAITMLVRQVEWSVQAKDDSPEAEEAQAFVDECLNDMSHSLSDMITEALTMLPYGFAPMEIVWKHRAGPDSKDGSRRSKFSDGKMGIRKISLRAQDTIQRWEFDDEGGLKGLYQQTGLLAETFIPIERLLLFRTNPVKNNPEGRSILRNCYRSYHFKKRIEEIEGIGIERDLAGLPMLRVPARIMSGDATADEKAAYAAYKQMVRNIRRDSQEGIILPSSRDDSGNQFYELELLSTGGTRQFDTTAIIDRYDRRISTSVMADFIFLGQGSSGSWALSSDKTKLFGTAIGTYLGIIKDVLNRYLLPRLWALNGFNPDMMPTITHGDIESPDLEALGNFVKNMTASGATLFPDRELENALRRAGGLPEAPEDGVEGDPMMRDVGDGDEEVDDIDAGAE